MPDLLPLGLCGASMILFRFDQSAGVMGWPHVVQIVRATQFQRAKVFRNPSFATAIDLSATQHADAAGFLPHPKAAMWGKSPANCGTQILDFDEWHGSP